MYYLVYKTTNKVNQRYYTGSHITDNLNDKYLGSGNIIKDAIKKYGRKAFTKEIIFMALDELGLDWAENQLVVTEDQDPMSYNIVPGGRRPPKVDWTGKKHTPETIEKIRKIKTGVKYSEESRKRMSESHKGISTWNKGLKNPEHSEFMKIFKLGKKQPPGTLQKAWETRRKNKKAKTTIT